MRVFKPLIVSVALLIAALVAGEAQVTKPHTFTDGEVIDAARQNANFDEIYSKALNRTGGTMTSTLTAQAIAAATGNTYDIGASGTRFRGAYFQTGDFSGNVTVGGLLDVTGTLRTASDGVRMYDTDSSHILRIHTSSNLTEDRALTFNPGDATRVVTLSGNPTLADWFDQSVKQAAAPTFAGATFTGPVQATATGYYKANATNGVRFINSTDSANLLLITNTGQVTFPAHPGFLAFNTANDTGQANNATIDFNSEVYDEGGPGGANFAGDTFTAPFTGRYQLCTSVFATAGTNQQLGIQLVTSNRTYNLAQATPSTGQETVLSGCVIADMDASDTAFVRLFLSTGTATIVGDGTQLQTHFSGRLVP